MAVVAVNMPSRMQLRLVTGQNEHGENVYRTRSYGNIKAAATSEEIFAVANGLSSLQVNLLDLVRRVDNSDLMSE